MSWRTTVILAIALAAASLFAWLDLRQTSPPQPGSAAQVPEDLAPTPAKLLGEFAPRDVEVIRLQRGALNVQIRRAEGGWTSVERPDVVDEFLVTLSEMSEILALQAAPEELVQYGLDSPASSLELLLREGGPIQLFVGDPNPAGTGVYVRIGRGGRVALAGALLRWEIDKVARAITSRGSAETTPGPEPTPVRSPT